MASRVINFLQPIRKYSLFKVQTRYFSSYRDKLKALPETKITTLDNGIRVATETTANPTVTVGIFLDAGIRYEDEGNNGVSTFLEHLLFSGTPKKNASKLEQELESLNVQLKSKTGREEQSLYATCAAADAPKVVEILSEIIKNVTFDEKEFERARSNILQKIDEDERNPRKIVLDYLHKAAYQGTSLGLSILGTTDTIKSLKKQDVEAFNRDTILGTRVVLSASGGMTHDNLVSLANKQLGALPNTYVGAIQTIKPTRFTSCEIRDREDDIAFPHYLFAIEGCGWDHPDNLALQIGRAIMGNWEFTQAGSLHVSNRVPSECIQEEYDLKRMESFYLPYRGTGLWGTYLINEMLNMEMIQEVFQWEWMRLCKNVFASEVEQAKRLIRVNTFNKILTSEGACKDIGRQVLRHNTRVSPAQFDANLEELNVRDVQEVMYEYIYDKSPVVIGFGPTQALYDYTRVRHNMYQLRL